MLLIVFSRFIHVVAWISTSFLFMDECYSTFYLSIHLLIEIWTRFHLLALMNNATLNIDIQVSDGLPVLKSFGYIPRSEIVELYGNFMFNFLKNH